MSITRRSNNFEIYDYEPENDENTLYIHSPIPFNDLVELCEEHFGSMDGLTISSEKIHTRCITYDLYDGSDWDDFIIVTKTVSGDY